MDLFISFYSNTISKITCNKPIILSKLGISSDGHILNILGTTSSKIIMEYSIENNLKIITLYSTSLLSSFLEERKTEESSESSETINQSDQYPLISNSDYLLRGNDLCMQLIFEEMKTFERKEEEVQPDIMKNLDKKSEREEMSEYSDDFFDDSIEDGDLLDDLGFDEPAKEVESSPQNANDTEFDFGQFVDERQITEQNTPQNDQNSVNLQTNKPKSNKPETEKIDNWSKLVRLEKMLKASKSEWMVLKSNSIEGKAFKLGEGDSFYGAISKEFISIYDEYGRMILEINKKKLTDFETYENDIEKEYLFPLGRGLFGWQHNQTKVIVFQITQNQKDNRREVTFSLCPIHLYKPQIHINALTQEDLKKCIIQSIWKQGRLIQLIRPLQQKNILIQWNPNRPENIISNFNLVDMTSNIKSTATLQVRDIDQEIETSILSDSSQKSSKENEQTLSILREVSQKIIWTNLEHLFDLNLLQFMARQEEKESLLILMIHGLEGRGQQPHKLIPDDSKIKFEMDKISLLFGQIPSFLKEDIKATDDSSNQLLQILASFESKLLQKTPLGLLQSQAPLAEETLSDSFQSKLRKVFGLILKKRLPIIEQITEGNQMENVIGMQFQGRISKVCSNSKFASKENYSKYNCSSMVAFFNFWRIFLFVENEELVLDEFAKVFMSSIFAKLIKHEKFQLEKHFRSILDFLDDSGKGKEIFD